MNYNFGLTSKIDTSLKGKFIKQQNIKDLLNEKLTMSNYTNDLNKILLVYLALNPNLPYKEENFQRFRRKDKIVEIGINLDYFELLQADEEKTLQLLAEAYLKGIEKYLLPRKDFNGNQFYNDVKQLFTEHRLIMD